MDDNDEAIGLARGGVTIDAGAQRQHQWLLLIPLLALGYGFYTQFDRIRAMLAPEPVAEVRPAPVATPEASPAVAAPPAPTVSRIRTPAAEPEPPVPAPSIPAPPAPAKAALQPLFPAPAPSAPSRRSGRAGLVEALRSGEIRLGTVGDIGRWKSSYARASGRGVGRYFDERTGGMAVYLVQKDFEIPADLAGANAVVFVLDGRAPFPRGDAGHSPILDTDSGVCVGAICRMLLSDD